MAKDASGTQLRTAAIILAAGSGSRFGGGKMLALIDGRPMLQHVLDLAAAAELDPVVVVLGADAELIEAALTWRGELRVRNHEPDRGISSSLAAGLRAFGDDVDGALVLLGDQPFVTPENVRVINDVGRDPVRPVVVPRYANGPGNPVLLQREAWPLALRLEGDRGMSQLFDVHPELVRYVELPGANLDIDTRGDLAGVAEAPSLVRRQIYELTPPDLQLYPLWEFALDEEGESGQDEATVRPVPDRVVAMNGDVVRSTFVGADGDRFTGYVTPHTWCTPGWLQPTIVSAPGQVNFWLGWRQKGVLPDDLRTHYELLGTSADRLFPITYRLDVPWEPGSDEYERAQLKRLGASDEELFPHSRWLARSPGGKLVGTISGFTWFSEPNQQREIR